MYTGAWFRWWRGRIAWCVSIHVYVIWDPGHHSGSMRGFHYIQVHTRTDKTFRRFHGPMPYDIANIRGWVKYVNSQQSVNQYEAVRIPPLIDKSNSSMYTWIVLLIYSHSVSCGIHINIDILSPNIYHCK